MVEKTKKQAGFTLIEVSIAILVMGLLMAPMVQLYTQYRRGIAIKQTYENIEQIASWMGSFRTQTGRYPCPADPNLSPDDANYGREINATCDPVLIGVNLGACGMGNGVCYVQGSRDTDYDVDVANDEVVIGAVPIVTLREELSGQTIPLNVAIDSWSSKIIYAVSRHHVIAPEFMPGNGVITAINEFGFPTAGIDTPGDADFVILSHGQNKNGAVTLNGAPYDMCGIAAGGMDNENCDNDSIFVQAIQNMSEGANRYDDYTFFSKFVQTSLWQRSGSYIYNVNSGNVGIATDTPAEKLDVNGTIAMDATARIDTICSNPSNNATCFNISTITGNTIQCPPGQVLVSIGDTNNFNTGDACATPVFNATLLPNQTCPFNQWVIGFRSNGEIICSAL